MAGRRRSFELRVGKRLVSSRCLRLRSKAGSSRCISELWYLVVRLGYVLGIEMCSRSFLSCVPSYIILLLLHSHFTPTLTFLDHMLGDFLTSA